MVKDALARDVDEAGELPVGSSRLEELLSQEGGDLGSEVDAVDEDIDCRGGFGEPGVSTTPYSESQQRASTIKELREGSALGRFSHVPLDDVLPE